MATITPVDIAYFNSFADEIAGKFKRLSHLSAHGGASGNYHEEVLRSLLRNFLTKRYSVKTGFMYKDKENVSRQLDIMVIDENAPAAYIFQEGEFAVVLPESVVAFIEIKTTFSVKEFDNSIQNIASAKRLMKFPVNHCGIIFGYQSDLPQNDTKMGKWFGRPSTQHLDPSNKTVGPDAIILFKENYSLFHYNPANQRVADGLNYHRFRSTLPLEIGWQLSILLAMIVSACEMREFNITRQFGRGQANQLLSTGMLDVSDDEFVLGVGRRPVGKS